MSVFNKLKQQLNIKLQQVTANNGIIEIKVTSSYHIENEILLGWLKSQSHFPKYYWQNREDCLTLTSIGMIKSFSKLEDAQQFIQQTKLTLFGGMQFSSETTFILPRLFFVKKENNLSACLIIDTNNLDQEIKIIEPLFEEMKTLSRLQKTNHKIVETKFSTTFEQWQANINKAIQTIKNNQFNKVVLANATEFTCKEEISGYDLLALSQQKNPQCFHFLWQEKPHSTFIGSSPERLYKREQNILYTEALAGTVAVSEDPEQTRLNGEWLLKDPKNIIENQFVVDDICLNLKAYTQNIEVSKAELKKLPNVQHLRRFIKMTLNQNIYDTQCLHNIHPTAAIAGLPRDRALSFIDQTENFKRGWYAGTLGYFNSQKAEFCVTLRSATIQQNKMTVYAGAGIVENSTPKSEWQEIQRKALAMSELLDLD